MFYGKTKTNHAILSNGNIKNGPIEVITICIGYLSLFKPKVAKSLMLEFDPICQHVNDVAYLFFPVILLTIQKYRISLH